MQCHYHPEREGTDVCAICGKSICKECGLEIAGKIYCKDCLEKIVGLSLDNSPQSKVESEPVYVEEQPIEENIYQPQEEYEIPYAQEEEVQEYKAISDDSPYNIKDSIEYSGGLESSYLSKEETLYQEEPQQVTQNEYEPQEVIQQQPTAGEQEYIYPDHDYEPPKTSARQELEDKYEKYLDDLYFDENEMPLGEQLAKDEEQYGSLTKKEYAPRPVEETPERLKPEVPKKPTSRPETPEEMEARIRAEIAAEQGLKAKKEETGIHNINYKDEKEPMGVVDILLTVILLIVILIVIYYIVYLFLLQASYPTFIDAVYALKNPQNVINAILSK